MAVIDILPGVEVEVVVGETALKEYEDSDTEEEECTVTRYIEVQPGQTFAILCKVLPEFDFIGDCICFDFYVDGQKIEGKIVKKEGGRRQATS
jgi:cytochrome c oxidase assembly protein Cox11